MSIYQSLKADHDKVKEIMQKLRRGQGPRAEEQSFKTLKNELRVHSKAEEKVFYSTLKEHREAQQIVQQSEREHTEIEDMLEEMASLDTQSEQFTRKLEQLRGKVDDHVEEEEGEMFQTARKIFSDDQARRLDEAFQNQKSKLMQELGKDTGLGAEMGEGART